ncbi:hypothetical protein H1230_06745 [Paenibacillus sp. 19GGS1-52]|uniref:hypothetical protein n=1 Tax=Paenibacillus sp. 19GGS1-52 TaxID=2758563 RepID=UPI001EFBA3FF|nr:hypothetical protein [Paenibacillus sp. 19GGS1-52]ULO08499.1 hypothetical protein H1230_06745 [Paenibacillus sp. 19GGS1-52]
MNEAIELKKEIINDLLKLIPEAIKEISTPQDQKICFVALYRSDYDPLVGLIQIGFEDVRQSNFEEGGIWMAWNSGDQPYKYQNDLKEQSLKEKEKRFINLFDPDEYYGEWWKQCIDVMNQVSMKLNDYDWNSVFKDITDDFVVYIDWEGLDVENGELESCIPKNKLMKLKEKGIVK